MIRLIITDIDGTLGPDGTSEVPKRLLEIIPLLKQKGILFAAASGRQLVSLKNLFKGVLDDVIFIAENGAYVVCRDTCMSVSPMNRALVEELTADLRTFEREGGFLTASTPEAIYVENNDTKFLDFLINGYKNNTKVVKDVLKLDTPIIKMSLYREDGIGVWGSDVLIPKWRDRIKAVMAGTMWLDFMDLDVDKGYAVQKIQDITGILPEECICFGDNENDCSMFKRVGASYAVENALPIVKEMATHVIPGYRENGVIGVLEKILKECEEQNYGIR